MASEEYEQVIHNLAAYGSAAFLGLWIVVPSLLGLGMRIVAPEAQLTALMPVTKLINSVVLLLLNYSNGSVSLPQAVADRGYDFLAGPWPSWLVSVSPLFFRLWVEPSV